MELEEKLALLAQAAKYDVSCSSSGSNRINSGRMGNTLPAGICHSWSDDGRCVSLLKILLSNSCIYDCAYCINRRTNDTPRTRFTVDEVVDLTINFYKRNYIEGLFLSSGIIKSPDHTMNELIRVIQSLRTIHQFQGYIHVKAIPGASDELIRKAGLYADRLSVNIEIPSEPGLKLLAPDKSSLSILKPMHLIGREWSENREERKNDRRIQPFVPAGQSTQLVIGATPDTDYQILKLSSSLYRNFNLKRVYYSAYIPVTNADKRLPAIQEPPLRRENRLYQADWLLRFYQFDVDEIINAQMPNLDNDLDPKMFWALKNLHFFPVDINHADYATLLRVPGIGVRSAQRILHSRRFRSLNFEALKRIGISMKRSRFFITCPGNSLHKKDLDESAIRRLYLTSKDPLHGQLLLF